MRESRRERCEFRDPFRRARGTRRGPSAKPPARPSRSRRPPSRSDRGSRRWRGRPPARQALFGCRAGASRRRGRAAVRAAGRALSSRCDTEIASSEIVFSSRVIGEHAAHQLLGDLGQHRGRRDRRVERDRAGDRAQDRRSGRAPSPCGRAATWRAAGWRRGRRDAAASGTMTRSSAGFRPSADCAPAECARRCVLICARIAVPGQRGELLAGGADRAAARATAAACSASWPMVRDADLGQPRLGRRADAPHQLDRQIVQEGELGAGIDHHQPVGLGDLRGDLGQMLGARHADRDRQAEFARARGAGSCAAISAGGPNRCVQPATSAKASSMEMRSTSGVKSSSTVDRRVAQPLVVAEMAADEDQLRAKLARPAARHAAAHAEGLAPRRTRRAPRRRRPRSACRAATGRAAARPRHRRRRGRHGGWWLSFPSRRQPATIFVRPRVAKRSGGADRRRAVEGANGRSA